MHQPAALAQTSVETEYSGAHLRMCKIQSLATLAVCLVTIHASQSRDYSKSCRCMHVSTPGAINYYVLT